MLKIASHWYLLILMPIALFVNETTIQWLLAVKVGGHSLKGGYHDAFRHFSILGYLFFTAFRLMPYAGLAITVVVISRTSLHDYAIPVFIGGLAGILAMIIWGSWMSLRPLYTDEHVSSTTAIAFIFIPLYALPAGGVGAALISALYTPFRFIIRKSKV